MYTLIQSINIYIHFFIYYNHIRKPLSEDYTVYMYMNMYIFIYNNHICIPLFKGFI